MTSSALPQHAPTVALAFRETVREHESAVAVRTLDGSVEWTWRELGDRVDALAGGLRALGVDRGETVAIMLVNRPEFHLADLAVVTAGGTPFSIYQTYTPDQIAYVVSDSGAKVIITETAFLPVVQAAREQLADVEHVILIDPPAEGAPAGTTPLSEVEGSDPDFDAAAAAEAVQPDDVLTLIYTSGTTGPPKGVELTHGNVMSVMEAFNEIVDFPPGARVISWLPAAHIAERNAHHYAPVVLGFQVTTLANPREIVAALTQVHPQWFFAVPRIWEKLKAGLETMVHGQPAEQREPLERALADAVDKVRREQRGEEIPADLAERVAVADTAHFAQWRSMLGLDEVVAINVGAAPTPVEVLEFFHAIGLPVSELWGMSETSGSGTVNRPGKRADRHRRPARPGRRGAARRRRRGPRPRGGRDARLPQQARPDLRHDRPRRLAPHG